MLHYYVLQFYSRLELKLKNILFIKLKSQCLKPYVKFNTHKKVKAEINDDKGRKALYKLMNNGVHDKAKENLSNKTDVRLVNNDKDYLKQKSKPSFMSE